MNWVITKSMIEKNVADCSALNETAQQLKFHDPITEKEIRKIEKKLKQPIPSELLQYLQVTCGFDIHDPYYGWTEAFLGFKRMMELLKRRPDSKELKKAMKRPRKVLFFAQYNGFSYWVGYVIKPFLDYTPGQIVCYDADAGEFYLESPSFIEHMTNVEKFQL